MGSEQRGAREAMGYRRVGSIHAQCCAAPALINISTSKEGRSATVRNEIATKEASFWLLTVGFRLIPCSTRVYLSFSFPEVCTFLCSSSKRGPSLFYSEKTPQSSPPISAKPPSCFQQSIFWVLQPLIPDSLISMSLLVRE